MYGKKKLLADCARMKWRKREDTSTAEKLRMMEEVWDALNAWVMERLDQGKGAAIANFATVTWDGRMMVPGQQHLAKPCFMLSESFAKSFGLPFKKYTRVRLAPVEDVSFTKIAIRLVLLVLPARLCDFVCAFSVPFRRGPAGLATLARPARHCLFPTPFAPDEAATSKSRADSVTLPRFRECVDVDFVGFSVHC